MPQTFDNDDCRLELEDELATAQDPLKAEIAAHKRTARSLAWYRARVEMLQREQRRMRDPERTLVCDIAQITGGDSRPVHGLVGETMKED